MGIPGSLGIGSGLNLGSLLDKLAQSEQQRLLPLKSREISYTTKLSAYGQLQGALGQLKAAAAALGESPLYHGVTVSTASAAFSATASSESIPGRYQIAVTQLAAAQSLVSQGVVSTTDAIGSGGTITLELGDGAGNVSQSVTVTIGSEQSTLAGIRDAINAADIGISAAIVNDGSSMPYRLTLSSQASGTDSQISVQVNDASGTQLSDLLSYDSQAGTGNLQETVVAANAELAINGIAISSQSNVVAGAIQGVTLTLSKTTSQPETLVAARDNGSIKSALEEFVSAYNNLQSIKDNLTAYNGPDANNGVLLGDHAARTVDNQLRRALNTPVAGGDYFGLAQIGISIQRDGTMAIDSAKLDKALSANLSGVQTLMTGTGAVQGLSQILTGTIKGLAGDNGVLGIASDGLEASIDNVHERMQDMQERIDASIARYRAQFIQLDSIMAQLNSTQSYLTRQFEALSDQQQ